MGGLAARVACLLLPSVAVVANRGTVVVLCMAAAAAAAAIGAGELWRVFLVRLRGLPLLFLFTLFAWAAVSLSWAPSPGSAGFLWFRLVLLAGAGLVLFVALPSPMLRPPDAAQRVLTVGWFLGLGSLVIAAIWLQFLSNPSFLPAGYHRLSRLNPGACVLVLALCPVAGVLLHRRRRGLFVAAVLATIGCLAWLPAGAAVAAFIVGAVVFLAAWAGHRLLRTIGVLSAVVILAAPVLVWAPQAVGVREPLLESMPPSWQHRVYIWEFTADRIAERPLAGWGFDASRRIPGGKTPSPVGSELMPLHPHNAALQVWLELGLPGALATALLVFSLIEAIVRSRPPGVEQAAAAAALTAYLTISATAFGTWQYWWQAVAWFLAAALAVAIEPSRSAAHR